MRKYEMQRQWFLISLKGERVEVQPCYFWHCFTHFKGRDGKLLGSSGISWFEDYAIPLDNKAFQRLRFKERRRPVKEGLPPEKAWKKANR